jgi:hypothetical protein
MATAHSKDQKSEGIAVPAMHHAVDPLTSDGRGHGQSARAEQADPVVPQITSSGRVPEADPACQVSDLLARGKDVLSAEVGGVATAAVIGIGAALIEVELIPGLIIGAGAILLGKMFPDIGSYARPMLKAAVRAGLSASQKLREVVAEANEEVHDLVAEVEHEREQAKTLKPTHAADPFNAVAIKPAH